MQTMKMKCPYIAALIVLLLASVAFPVQAKEKARGPFLRAKVDREKVTEGERLIYEVVLFTPNPEVAGVESVYAPDFSGLPNTQSSADTRLEETVVDGQPYFSAVIDRYFLGVNQKGKYTIKGGAYKVGLNRRVRVNDPFWGPMVENEVDVFTLQSPDMKVQATALPEKGRPDDFSGAIGNYEVTAYLPEGIIRAGEDATLIISISGFGDLTDAALPDIRKAFPEDLQFKSMTDNRSHYVKDGRLGSEIEIECTFTPHKEGCYDVKGIDFNFFNSETGQYATATAPEVHVDVVTDCPEPDTPPEILDI